MNRTFKWIVGIVIVVLVVVLISLVSKNSEPNSTEPIKIGLIGPLTGDAALYGTSPKNGAELAIEEINASGGINGKRLELVSEDSKCDAKEAVNSITKLINVDNVKFVVGGMCSSETLAAAPIAESNKVIMISPDSTSVKVSEAGDYIFRTVASDALQGKKVADVAYEMGFRKAAVLYIGSNDAGPALEKVFREEFVRLGGAVIISEGHLAGSSDFRTSLTKVKFVNPDVIFIPSQMPENALVVKQIKELGIKAQVIGTETMQDENFVKTVGNLANGVIFTSFAEYKGVQADAFSIKFKAKYNEDKTIYSDYAYDAVYAWKDAMITCGGQVSSVCVKEQLYRVKFIGATGPINFDKNGDIQGKDFAVFKIENGKFVLAK